MHQDGVAPLDKDRAIACALRLVPAHPGGSGRVEIYGSRYCHCGLLLDNGKNITGRICDGQFTRRPGERKQAECLAERLTGRIYWTV